MLKHLMRSLFTSSLEVKTVQTSLLEIAYEEYGKPGGEPILLIHGFPYDAGCWEAVAKKLAHKNYHVFVPYLRGYGKTRFLSGRTMRSGEYMALTHDMLEFMKALGIARYDVVGHDWGAIAAYQMAALYPDRVKSLVTLAVPYAGNDEQVPPIPQVEAYWYQWFFNTEMGRRVLDKDRKAFCHRLWEKWSPSWHVDKFLYNQTAESFNNDDFVDIVIHSYRHRWKEERGDPRYKELYRVWENNQKISVPTIYLHGDNNGATLAAAAFGKDKYFTGHYELKILKGGIGHFIQMEDPDAVVKAVLKLRKLSR